MKGIAIQQTLLSNARGLKIGAKKSAGDAATAEKSGRRAADSALSVSAAAPSETAAAAEENKMQELCDYLHQLHNANPSVHFKIAGLSDAAQIKNFAVAAGTGAHFVLDPEFLRNMLQDDETFAKGKTRIANALNRLYEAAQNHLLTAPVGVGVAIKADCGASLWSASAAAAADSAEKSFFTLMNSSGMFRSYKETGGRNVTEIRTTKGVYKIVLTKRLNYSSTGDLKRLARTNRIGNIRAFMSGLSARIRQISSDKQLDEKEAAAAVAKLKGVISRAGIKIKHLKEEDLLKPARRKIHRKDAGEIAKLKIEIARLKELRHRRMERRAREFGAMDKQPLSAALLDDYKRRADRLDDDAAATDAPSDCADPTAALAAPAAEAAAPPAAIDASAVAISSIDIQV